MPSTLLTIQCIAPAAREDEVQAFLADNVPHGWEERDQDGDIVFSVHLENHELGLEIAQAMRRNWPEARVDVGEKEPEDWALAWKDFFVPLTCGDRFEVLPPWHLNDAQPGRETIVIEPKMAFGTGHHPTTALCLETFGDLMDAGRIGPGNRFLDLGTGSGILGLGCCLLGMHGLGLDIDPLAIENAEENKALNGVGEAFSLAVGSLELLEPGRTFPLVLANILAGPLKTMAEDLAARVAPGGCLVLSGILGEQADSVAAAYQAQGLPAPRREQAGEWTALVWERVAR